MNPKTRESVHGIFSVDASESSPASIIFPLQQPPALIPGGRLSADENSIAVKSVNYYCDIFRRQAPDLWITSVEAYRKFCSSREMQSTDLPADGSPGTSGSPCTMPSTESSSKPKRRRQSTSGRNNSFDNCTRRQVPMGQCPDELNHHSFSAFGSLPSSLASSVMLETPSSSLFSDFGSGFNSDANNDDGSSDHVLVSLAGHSWHKFLSQRNRWNSLGLNYSGKDDWVRQEAAFLVEHLFTLIDCDYPHSTGSNTEVPLTIVPQFLGTFDAPNIEMAVSRSNTMRTVRLSYLVDDLISCLEYVDNKEQFTVVSLCRLTDRQTRSTTSLALLASHGSNSQRFGVFPHNEPMLGRLIAGNENLWHEYSTQGNGGSGIGGLAPMAPKDEPLTQTAFAYAQSGIKYTFFVRLKGHFFEMTRDKDWMPTMAPTQPRAVWSATGISKDTFLSIMHHDVEKVLAGMVELYGLRLFCYGFFESIAVPSSNSQAGSARSPSRRISDDPSMVGAGYSRRNPPQHASRGRRSRVSAGTIGSSALSSNNSPYSGGNNLPYRRPPGHNSSSTSLNQLQQQQQLQQMQTQNNNGPSSSGRSVNLLGRNSNVNHLGEPMHAAMPFLSPQARHYNSFPSVDMASMSVSLPNSPYMCFPLDGQQFAQAGNGVAHESWFPSLNDAAFASNAASNISAAVTTAAATTAATAAAHSSSLLPTDQPLVSLTSIAAAGGISDDALTVNMYPSTSMQSNPAFGGTIDSMDTAPPMSHTGGGLGASSLFSSVVTGSTGSVLSNSPSFWDMSHANLNQHGQHSHHFHSSLTPASGSMSVPMGSISDMQSPNLHLGFRSPHSMAGLTGSMTEMSMAAAAMGGMAGRVSVDGGNMHFGGVSGDCSAAISTSIALYPPPHATPTMLGWDDMAAQSLSGVLNGTHHSADMLMQLAQPSPTLTHYNVSAHATPAFEAYSTPVLHHQIHQAAPSPYMPGLSIGSNMQADQSFLMHTPVSASLANPTTEVDGASVMAAYFGEAPHRTNNSVGSLASQETLMGSVGAVNDGQLSVAKGHMYSTTSGTMDVEFC
ncbi:hypothetical protein FBU31_002248 [Coemansia sp. 'formosensis']|nr:hypothetical protein FBU31_002248 [Coemansia sp. 'formosensis']